MTFIVSALTPLTCKGGVFCKRQAILLDDRIFPLSEKARKTSLFRPRKIYPVAKAEIDLGLRQNFLKSLRLMVKFLASLFSTEVRVS